MIFKRVLVGLLSLGCAVVLAQTPPRPMETSSSRVEVLGDSYQVGVAIGASQSRIVVYSPEGQRLPGATTIFVNGTYHTSLVGGGYSDLCYSPGYVQLAARQVEVGQPRSDRPDSAAALQLGGGQTQFVRVGNQGGRPVLQVVAAAQAERELASSRLQIHTRSRAAQVCVEVAQEPTTAPVTPAPVVVAQEIKRHTLAADALFASARSDREGMLPAGLIQLDRFIEQLPKQYTRVDSLKVIGHADPLGSRALNERLSLERAQTISRYIETNSQLRAPLIVEGRGSREPVVTGCSPVRSPESRICNQSNRRVDIEITGVGRP